MKAEAYFALRNFDQASAQYDFESTFNTWEDMRIRTLCFARSNKFKSANHFKALLLKELKKSVASYGRPYLTAPMVRAIDYALGLEMQFWEERDLGAFLRTTRKRLRRVKAKTTRRHHLLWAEYYSLALAVNSVVESVKGPVTELNELKALRTLFVKESLRARPSLKRRYMREFGLQEVLNLPSVDALSCHNIPPVHSSSWTCFAAGCQSRYLKPQLSNDHLKACRQIELGYVPISIGFGKQNKDGLRIGSVWHRQLLTKDLAQREQQAANAFCLSLKYNEDIGIWKILAAERSTGLKEKIIETIPRFRVDISTLLERLESSKNEFEQTSILKVLRNYSANDANLADAQSILTTLDKFAHNEDAKNSELLNIIRLNLESTSSEKSITSVDYAL